MQGLPDVPPDPGTDGPVPRSPAWPRPAGVAQEDPKPGMGGGLAAALQGKTSPGRRWPPQAPAQELHEAEGGWGLEGPVGQGKRPSRSGQAPVLKPAVPAARAESHLAPRGVGQALEVLRALPAESQLRAAAEWEGGGRARAPPSPPAVTGAITLLAADGYQFARASLSPAPLPSPPLPFSAELLAPS